MSGSGRKKIRWKEDRYKYLDGISSLDLVTWEICSWWLDWEVIE